MDFSGSKKSWYLHALRLSLEGRRLTWAKNIVGIRSQLTNYDPARDDKIAQDIVATLSMVAFAVRMYFHVDLEELQEQGGIEQIYDNIAAASREARLSLGGRTKRTGR